MNNQVYIMEGSFIGEHFDKVAAKAKGFTDSHTEVRFDFNGIECRVSSETDLSLLHRDYSNAHMMKWTHVGPICELEYSQAVLDSIRKAEERQAAENAKLKAEYKEKARQKKLAYETETAGTTIDLADPEGWDIGKANNQDDYGSATLRYAEAWGKIMQARMKNGFTVAEIADKASHDADFEGVTGFMLGAARRILIECWRHGGELKEWHEAERKNLY